MVAGAPFSADLSDAAWLDALRTVGKESGAYSDLGKSHSAIFVEKSHDVLFVAFETIFGIRSSSETGAPLAFDICERRNWSHMTVIAKDQSWFRDAHVFGFFDRLIDYGFFDQFEQVIFYGAGMCGYAAASFSVAAPGSQVFLISPQATLDRARAEWDDRFPSSRRLDFADRYAYAPDMLEAAESAYLIYDPDEIEDSVHASLFAAPNVTTMRYRRGGAGAIETDMKSMSLVSLCAEAALRGELNQSRLAHLMRARKRHVPYLRALLSRVLAEDRPRLTMMLCRAVLAEQPLPRFRHHLEQAEIKLGLRTQSGNAEADAPARRDDSQLS
ncbi:MAG: phosphoadenosine phosphosulfate reductase [Paracoccaceae bacterium]|nr:phosphoadenosine phosphosulfate reductase [Paracoccaceae bacterium]